MCELFEATKLKIKRAERHIADLDQQITEYLTRGSIAIVVELRPGPLGPEEPNVVARIRVREAVPKLFAPIIGDVIHNLRASLDLLACDLVRLNDGNVKKVSFPFSDTQSTYEDMLKEKNMHRAAPHVVAHLRTLRPYKKGDDALRAIHDLDIDDKHRTLISAPAMLSMDTGMAIFGPDGEQYPMYTPVLDGQVTMFMRVGQTDLKHGQELPGNFHLLFPIGGPLGGSDLIPTLHSLVQLVTGIVESFEALGLAQLSPSRSTR
jgi:hypothetical protein